MFWRKKETCPGCGRVLQTRDKSLARGVAMCQECYSLHVEPLVDPIAAARAADSNVEASIFLKKTLNTISLKTDVDTLLFSARCRSNFGSDVEIKQMSRGYDITFFTGLIVDDERADTAIAYAVDWIKSNPLTVKPLIANRIGEQALTSGRLFAFLFIPASRPLPTEQDVKFMEGQILQQMKLTGKFGWLICSQPFDDGSENESFITETLENWMADQVDSASIKLKTVPAETTTGRKLNCLLAFRDKPA